MRTIERSKIHGGRWFASKPPSQNQLLTRHARPGGEISLDSLAKASTSINVYIQDDELVEVTPKSIRLRKTSLDPNDRKRAERSRVAEGVA